MALKGKVAIITGSSSGIGAGIAVTFAKEGAKLSLTGRNQKNLEEVVKNCKKAGCEDVLINVGDITQDAFRRTLVEATKKKFGKIDTLIPDAGVYTMSKAALDIFTRYLAHELVSHGVRVNAINPGYVPTQLGSKELTKDEIDQVHRSLINATPIGRAGTPEEMGYIVAFLASDKAAFITGECFRADGGFTMTTPALG